MDIYCVSTLPIQQGVLDSNIEGIALNVYASNILAGNGYNNAFYQDLRNNIKNYADNGKLTSLAIIFGEFSSNAIFNSFPYVTMTKKVHGGTGEPKVIKLPVFWDTIYLIELNQIIQHTADELKSDQKVYDNIGSIKITGADESTNEMRATSQDWTNNVSKGDSFIQAAQKWLDAGWNYTTVVFALKNIIDMWIAAFPDKPLVLPYISGLNGFPCINTLNQICLPSQRPNITKEIIDYGHSRSANFYSQFTPFTNVNTPSLGSVYVQANAQVYKEPNPDKPVTDEDLQNLITNAENKNCLNLELRPQNILQHPNLFKK